MRGRQHGVQARGALAAAEHQQAHARLRDRRNGARAAAMATISGRTGLPTRSARTPLPKLSGNPSSTRFARRASTRLVRPATAFCSCTTSGRPSSHAAMPPGPDDEAARTEHDPGLCRRIARSAWLMATSRRNGRASNVAAALAAQPAHAEPLDRNACGRHEARLDAALRAEPDDVVAAPLQHARRRERREDVAAGAASHDQCDLARHVRRPRAARRRTRPVACVSWWMRSSTPSQPSVTSMLLPP